MCSGIVPVLLVALVPEGLVVELLLWLCDEEPTELLSPFELLSFSE